MKLKSIFQELQNGDESGLIKVYQRFGDEFVGYAKKKYGIDNDNARDFFIESVIEFRRNVVNGKLSQLDGNVKTYLFTIGRNLILNHIRENKLDYVADMKDYQSESQESHQEVLEKREFVLSFSSVFKQLPENCYEILKLFYYQNMTNKQVQQKLAYQSIETVRTRKYKCTRKLKQLISDQNMFDI